MEWKSMAQSNYITTSRDTAKETRLRQEAREWESSLLPCPICGQKPKLKICCLKFKVPGINYNFTVECPNENHFIEAYGNTSSEVISAWNTRCESVEARNPDGALACPFCGFHAEYLCGPDPIYDPIASSIERHIIRCSHCRVAGSTRRMVYVRSDKSKKDAIKMWNARKGKKRRFWQ